MKNLISVQTCDLVVTEFAEVSFSFISFYCPVILRNMVLFDVPTKRLIDTVRSYYALVSLVGKVAEMNK